MSAVEDRAVRDQAILLVVACVLVPALIVAAVVARLCGVFDAQTPVAAPETAVSAPVAVSVPAVPMPTVAPLACHEEDPCWDPASMGNGLAGPSYDRAGNAYCPPNMALVDTENPAVGDSGVVCESTLRWT